jgi:hypothetical protein
MPNIGKKLAWDSTGNGAQAEAGPERASFWEVLYASFLHLPRLATFLAAN